MGNWFVNRAVFQPPQPTYRLDGKVYTRIPTRDGNVIPISVVSHPYPKLAILYSHGNGEDLGCVHRWCEILAREFHAQVYSWDYRGYGPRRNKSPTEWNVRRDVLTVYDHVRTTFPENRILLFGRSLGCAPSIIVAGAHPNCMGLILESPFLTCVKTVLNTPFTFWFDIFRNEVNIKKCTLPTLIIHGKEDRVVPFSHGKRLYEEAPEPWGALWLERAGHNDIDSTWRHELFQKIHHFLDKVMPVVASAQLRRRPGGVSSTGWIS